MYKKFREEEYIILTYIKKHAIIYIIVFALLILALLIHIQSKHSVPTEVSEFYHSFLHNFSTGTFSDIDPYLHFEHSKIRDLTKQSFVNIQSYNIEKWEKINDDLWLAETTCQEDGDRAGRLCCHFIGFLDGKPYVMIGPQNVPKELSKGRDLRVYEKYEDDEVPFDAFFQIN